MKPTLTYCTNVHPGETLEEVERSLDRFTVPLKRVLAPAPFPADREFPVGLYLSAASARALADPARRERFRGFLRERGLAVATLNCFPYGGFHGERVKLEVYRPSWLDERRVEFTLAAARAFSALASERAVLPISTLAGSCKVFDEGGHDGVRDRIAANLARVAVELDRMAGESGREVVLCLEPEPFSTLETSGEAARFFEETLFGESGRAAFAAAGGERSRAEATLRRHVGLCFDACHQAVEHEEPAEALARIAGAGIRIGKVQLSSAIAARAPFAAETLAALRRFVEPRYLHQAIARRRDGSLERWLDLDGLLERPQAELAGIEEVRVHFHVPIDRAALPPLGTTQAFLVAAVAALTASGDRADPAVFEVETYTFPVLPEAPTDDDRLIAALASELRFASALMSRA